MFAFIYLRLFKKWNVLTLNKIKDYNTVVIDNLGSNKCVDSIFIIDSID